MTSRGGTIREADRVQSDKRQGGILQQRRRALQQGVGDLAHAFSSESDNLHLDTTGGGLREGGVTSGGGSNNGWAGPTGEQVWQASKYNE